MTSREESRRRCTPLSVPRPCRRSRAGAAGGRLLGHRPPTASWPGSGRGCREFTGALRRVAEHVLSRPGRRRPRDHRRAGRAQRHLTGDRHPVLPGAGLRRLRRPAARHRRRDRPGAARPAGRSTSAGRSSRPTRSQRVLGQIMAADTRAMHDTAALLDLAEVERAAEAIAGASRVEHLRRQRQRPGRRGDAVQPAPHRRRRVGLDRRAQRAGQRRAAAARRRGARHLAQRPDPARPSRCSPRRAAGARPRSR